MASKDDGMTHSKPSKKIVENIYNYDRREERNTSHGSNPQAVHLNYPPSKKNILYRDVGADHSFDNDASCLSGFEHMHANHSSGEYHLQPDIIEATNADLVTKFKAELQIQNSNQGDHFSCLRKENLEKGSVSNERENSINNSSLTSKLLTGFQRQNKVGCKLKENAGDVADLIVGSHRALEYLLSFYNEWTTLRTQSLSLLTQLRGVINTSCKNSKTVDDILACINIASRAMENVPHPNLYLGGKIAAAIGRVFTYFFASKLSKEDLEAKELEIKQTFQKDIDSSSSVYIFGIQCSTQFEETRQAIRNFHRTAESDDFETFQDHELLQFLNEIVEYNPGNDTVFYRRLRFCYERLMRNSKSEESRAFIRVFDDIPEAVEVVDLLPWRFDTDSFDNTVVNNAWKDVFDMFQEPESFDIKQFLHKIENCLFFLNKEQAILERAVIRLLIKKV